MHRPNFSLTIWDSNQSKKEIMKQRFYSLAVLALVVAVSTNVAFGQEDSANDDGDKAMQRIAGTWSLDLDETLKGIDDEAKAEMMRERLADMEVQMVFGADGKLDMIRGGETMPGEPTYSMTQGDDEDSYDIEINGPSVLNGSIQFVDLRTIRVKPEGEDNVVMVRSDKPLTLEEAKKLFTGRWDCNKSSTKKIIDADDELELPGDGEVPDVFVVFGDDGSIELGEGSNAMSAKFSVEKGEEDHHFNLKVEGAGGPEDISLAVEVISRYQIFVIPEGQGIGVVFDRTPEK